MKNILLLLFSFLLISNLKAQDFSIGPKFGVSQANIKVNGDGFESGEDRMGYHIGAFVRMGGASIFVQPEFLYTNTGGFIIDDNNNTTIETSFNRLDIPMMVGFKLAKFFRIQAGPIASILLDQSFGENPIAATQNIEYRNSTIGYQAGIGLDLGNLILDAKYESSLNKIAGSVAGFQTDQRQTQLVLSAGFRLF
ncbi:Outer membrane protein beta-barrel domain-containing protein [Belliella buryatensis]|uniref:Outer membrane protein beta-barrel domain-containing protein n=1 Tax=Belliella buryatensis TaxID=1500549 RepID=A0A239BE87_9BACT|nr:porin family protein [Belliella buryatensis]SNS05363.1 Outer membrane protein beta-barrel domain-containing protein [Belliella buryatensis]